MNSVYVNRIYQAIAGGIVAAFLAVPAFGQAKLTLTDCSDPTKIVPAAKALCEADMAIRTDCNKTSNPAQCYNTKKAAQTSVPATTQTAPNPAAAPAPAPVAAKPTDPNIVTSIPQGARNCANDSGKCLVVGNWTGVYGANNAFAKISGSGDFICLPSTFKINDPAPGVAKSCWVIGAAPAAPAPVAAALPKVNQLPLSCKGGLVNSPTKTFTIPDDFSKNGYGHPVTMAATDLTGATTECMNICAKTGEPAPCGWYTLVQWRSDTSADKKSRMVYACYMVQARNYKDAFKPKMATDKNFGNASNGMFFKEAYTYPCAR